MTKHQPKLNQSENKERLNKKIQNYDKGESKNIRVKKK